jgi:hypothetical protein
MAGTPGLVPWNLRSAFRDRFGPEGRLFNHGFRCVRVPGRRGAIRKRVRHLSQDEWAVLIRDHHLGFIDWESYEANQRRLAQNNRPCAHQGSGAVREGAALLQRLATCGYCGPRLRTHHRGRNSPLATTVRASMSSTAAASIA